MVSHFLCIPCIPKAVLPFFMLLNIVLLVLEKEEICPGFVLEKKYLISLSSLYFSLGYGVNISSLKLKRIVFIRHLLARFPRSMNHWFRMTLLDFLLSFSRTY